MEYRRGRISQEYRRWGTPVSKLSGPDFEPLWARIAAEYQRYLESDVERDLARYIYFLENGAYPGPKQRLPRL
jgi:hypothetical protein